jgi:hypothetical protein
MAFGPVQKKQKKKTNQEKQVSDKCSKKNTTKNSSELQNS